MVTQEFLNHFKDIVNTQGQEKIFEFFIVFARFECAMKNNTNYVDVRYNRVYVNWDRFTMAISERFNQDTSEQLNSAVNYILENPPKFQSIQNENTVWVRRNIPENTPITNQLGLHIRTIRNNLFHGGKFSGVYEPDVSRNYRLIDSSLIILNNWLDIEEDLKIEFLKDI